MSANPTVISNEYDIKCFPDDESQLKGITRIHFEKNVNSNRFKKFLDAIQARDGTPSLDGQIIGGDFNFNFLELDENLNELVNLNVLSEWLAKNGYAIDIDPDWVPTAMIKRRTDNVRFNQQFTTLGGNVDFSVKDLAFKVRKLKANETDPIPEKLRASLHALAETRSEFLANDRTMSDAEVNQWCRQKDQVLAKTANLVSYSDFKNSHGHDHPPAFFGAVVFQNSVLQEDYDVDAHFNCALLAEQNVDQGKLDKMYQEYKEYVARAFIKFILVNQKINGRDRYTDQEIKEALITDPVSFVQGAVADKSLNGINKSDALAFFTNVLNSKEYKEIDQYLKVPYLQHSNGEPLTHKEIHKMAKELSVGQKSWAVIAGEPKPPPRIDKMLNACFQAWQAERAKAGMQCVSMNGSGFAPFKLEDGKNIDASAVHDEQVSGIVQTMDARRKVCQGEPPVLVLIEGAYEGQQDKCQQLRAYMAQQRAVAKVEQKEKANVGSEARNQQTETACFEDDFRSKKNQHMQALNEAKAATNELDDDDLSPNKFGAS